MRYAATNENALPTRDDTLRTPREQEADLHVIPVGDFTGHLRENKASRPPDRAVLETLGGERPYAKQSSPEWMSIIAEMEALKSNPRIQRLLADEQVMLECECPQVECNCQVSKKKLKMRCDFVN